MASELILGWRSAVLLCAVLVIIPVSFALLRSFDNRSANRVMAALLLVLVGVITPWLIGFAGFYDRWPWLTFLPVAQPLLAPPLLLAYVEVTTGGRPLNQLRRWFLPGLVTTLFESVSFLLPLQKKLAWSEASARVADSFESVLLILMFVLVLVRTRMLVARYRHNLAEQRSDGSRFALTWLMRLISVMTLLWSLWASYALATAFIRVTYDGYMPLYLAIAATAVWLSIEAWRHAQLPWPILAPLGSMVTPPSKQKRDWRAAGEDWATTLQQAEAYREPTLTLRRAARIAGTNEAYLSRACNEGLGMSFSALIQRLRSDAVAVAIDNGATEDLLTLAHNAGFASKASFNRAFATRFGMSPSAYRRRLTFVKNSGHPAE